MRVKSGGKGRQRAVRRMIEQEGILTVGVHHRGHKAAMRSQNLTADGVPHAGGLLRNVRHHIAALIADRVLVGLLEPNDHGRPGWERERARGGILLKTMAREERVEAAVGTWGLDGMGKALARWARGTHTIRSLGR